MKYVGSMSQESGARNLLYTVNERDADTLSRASTLALQLRELADTLERFAVAIHGGIEKQEAKDAG